MKIGLFGGSFDPVHQGHYQLAGAALRQFGLDRVIWIPAYFSPFKNESQMQASSIQRLDMVRLVCANTPQFEVSDFEAVKPGPSYAVETVRHFRSIHPQASLYWILGEDAFGGLIRWHEFESLSREVVFLVGGRTMREVDLKSFPGQARLIDMDLHPAASSNLKMALERGEGWQWLNQKVCDYIRLNRLYGAAA